jgi:23S rRNA (uracil1939-C5)-methyltransferase
MIPNLHYRLEPSGLDFYFKPTQFSQVNPEINQKMVGLALEKLNLQATDTVADLFCGFGNFTLPIAKIAEKVIGVEGSLEAVEQAKINAAHNQLAYVNFFMSDLSKEKGWESWANTKYNKVLLDPPRTGAEILMPWLLKCKPERIVYISCNPATLARDVGILTQNNQYILAEAGVLDMFPHTQHVESIALLKRV